MTTGILHPPVPDAAIAFGSHDDAVPSDEVARILRRLAADHVRWRGNGDDVRRGKRPSNDARREFEAAADADVEPSPMRSTCRLVKCHSALTAG